MLKLAAAALVVSFGINALAEGQAVLDGMLMLKDNAPSVMQVEGPAARALYARLVKLPIEKTEGQGDCPIQWIKTGLQITCAYCGTSSIDDDIPAKYWCTMRIDMASGHVRSN
jgi:hypothetical protein